MEFISSFLAERWFVIAGALLVLFLVVKIVKTVVKWVIVLAVLAGLFFYGASYKDQLMELGTTVGAKVAEEAKTQALKTIKDEMKDAQYKVNADGTFTVSTKSVKLEGKPGANEVKVSFMNQSFTMPLDTAMNALVEQAKKNSGM